ncbi:MAG TPA: flagellar biosynthesis protein FlhF [Nitrosomonas europaea]|uniref:flagellar biosynthesis protein FlhF n=1 Tax=Nitrosomonas europaea TaxID=915 RepID=UPI00248FD9EE|nr:flagellar biosynthesis protein FlhF [Nitrosomonas europaea]HRN80969.1 flagellar biosynthesis protein FlhF [Nitrosomonas europaea]HRO55546.1 flagellar biosynthesis protein FlhF [Nitrosomonas europaea]HRQ07435.1 flagellar biosynthesis protein FlhF [Nitrosomonas europaea]HUM73156.1 flagellar biosynthesis protein FlhF [Nitrosomonas europaea]
MKVRKFLAATSHEVLRKVKDELGPDAVILSNKQVPGGIEIMALAGKDISSLTSDTPPEATSPAVKTAAAPRQKPASEKKQAPPVQKQPAVADIQSANILQEIHAMRQLLEEQLITMGWSNFSQRDPGGMKVLRTLLSAGFSPLLSRHLLEKLPADRDFEQSLKKTIALLTLNLRTTAGDEIIEQGGIYALIGPTGVGKTTTTAKLAARAVIRHGADKVALLTTDSYRIGGHEQLRIYGKLLGISVRSIKDIDDLQLMLHELRGKHMVLIDTVGMSQRDQMLAEQITMLSQCGTEVKHLLLLNATSSGDTLEEVISAYQQHGIHGCIITKVDEAASLGVALDAVIRRKLVLHYVTNGQKVPEDLHEANSRYLLHRIFKPSAENSPFSLQDPEFAMLMAGNYADQSVTRQQTRVEASHDQS